MTLSEMNSLVASELARYPRGQPGSEQNFFRSVFQNVLMNSLGKDPHIQGGRSVIEAEAIRILRGHFPAFTPTVDR